MLCDKYKEALIEAAASGTALPIALREHVGACAGCRATLTAQQTIFAAIDAGLHSRTNLEVPANFDHRVRAALELQASPEERRYSSVFAFGLLAAAAAVAMAILLTHNPNQRMQEGPPLAIERAEASASHSTAAPSDSNEIEPSSHQVAHSRASTLNVPQRSKGGAPRNQSVEVLVPKGQQELLVKYIEGIAARRPRVAVTASLQHEPEMKPIEVSPVEISALVVKPLPDLSSN
jgi:anti-sigma-K factor RskA